MSVMLEVPSSLYTYLHVPHEMDPWWHCCDSEEQEDERMTIRIIFGFKEFGSRPDFEI